MLKTLRDEVTAETIDGMAVAETLSGLSAAPEVAGAGDADLEALTGALSDAAMGLNGEAVAVALTRPPASGGRSASRSAAASPLAGSRIPSRTVQPRRARRARRAATPRPMPRLAPVTRARGMGG